MEREKRRMQLFRKAFFVLLLMDSIELILTGIAMLGTYELVSGYGQMVFIVASVIGAVIVVVTLFEILAKVFLARSASPAFSWSSGHKGYTAAAKLLLIFNMISIIFNLLSAGGEGATLMNQGRLYIHVLASLSEIIIVFFYLRTVKTLRFAQKGNGNEGIPGE